MSFEDRIHLILTWSTWFYDHTETFNGALGLSLAYLWPAIARGGRIEVAAHSAIVRLLKREGIPPRSEIWNYIDVC